MRPGISWRTITRMDTCGTGLDRSWPDRNTSQAPPAAPLPPARGPWLCVPASRRVCPFRSIPTSTALGRSLRVRGRSGRMHPEMDFRREAGRRRPTPLDHIFGLKLDREAVSRRYLFYGAPLNSKGGLMLRNKIVIVGAGSLLLLAGAAGASAQGHASDRTLTAAGRVAGVRVATTVATATKPLAASTGHRTAAPVRTVKSSAEGHNGQSGQDEQGDNETEQQRSTTRAGGR